MNRYKKTVKPYIHKELAEIISLDRMPITMLVAFGLITYVVRIFSYTEAGPIYGASAVMSIAGFFFFSIFLKRVGTGKIKVHFRRDYKGFKAHFMLLWNIYVMSWGIFLGNIIYYLSRFRIWSDPTQLLNIVIHTFNLSGLLIGAAFSLFIFYYAFLADKFIESDDYARRMRYKMHGGRISEQDAFIEVREEQDNFWEFGALQLDKKETMSRNRPGQMESVHDTDSVIQETDIYESARIKRGD